MLSTCDLSSPPPGPQPCPCSLHQVCQGRNLEHTGSGQPSPSLPGKKPGTHRKCSAFTKSPREEAWNTQEVVSLHQVSQGRNLEHTGSGQPSPSLPGKKPGTHRKWSAFTKSPREETWNTELTIEIVSLQISHVNRCHNWHCLFGIWLFQSFRRNTMAGSLLYLGQDGNHYPMIAEYCIPGDLTFKNQLHHFKSSFWLQHRILSILGKSHIF